MGLMDEAMRADAEFTADTDQGSEEVAYTRAGGSAATVRVTINRLDAERDIGSDQPGREFEVWIPYSSSYGLTTKPAEGDQIAVKDDDSDGSTTDKQLDRILESDAGGWLCRFI
jgi:hypothetical protein